MGRNSLFVCQQCGNEESKWFGKCPDCGQWGSLVETAVVSKSSRPSRSKQVKKATPISLNSVTRKKTKRISSKISELDRVLGGGLVSGQVVLIAGEPGIGKSTILLQLAEKLGDVLYASGEESVTQIKIRADRLGVKKKTIQIVEETDIDTIINAAEDSDSKAKSSSFFFLIR